MYNFICACRSSIVVTPYLSLSFSSSLKISSSCFLCILWRLQREGITIFIKKNLPPLKQNWSEQLHNLNYQQWLNNSNRTEWSPICFVIIPVIKKILINKSDSFFAVACFVNHKNRYRKNWMTQSPVTYKSKLYQYSREKLDVSDAFS